MQKLIGQTSVGLGDIYIHDARIGIDGTTLHFDNAKILQGFTRGRSGEEVLFRTINDAGIANVRIFRGAYEDRRQYQRAIRVPIHLSTGEICVESLVDPPKPVCKVHPGHYELTFALIRISEEEESVDFFFRKVISPLRSSAIIRKDEYLHPPDSLIED